MKNFKKNNEVTNLKGKNRKVGLLLYLFFVLQRVNIVMNFIMLFNIIFFITNIVNIYVLGWELYVNNIVLFFVICGIKCLIIPIKEFITVLAVSFFENTQLVDEILDLPTRILNRLNNKIKE